MLKNLQNIVNEYAEKFFRMMESAPGKFSGYAKDFKESDLWEKIGKTATKAGQKLVYIVLVLYYGLSKASLRDKGLILGALGYFILPADLIPDWLPLGFTDDLGALLAVYKSVKGSLNPEAHHKASERMRKWFADFDEEKVLRQLEMRDASKKEDND